MRFLNVIVILLLFEEYQCRDINSINATHCEYTKRRRIPGKKIAENVTSLVSFMETNKDKRPTIGTKIILKTLMKPAIETIRRVDCCPGYKAGPKKSCIPKCEQFCENSKCTAPNECSCNEGFKRLSPNRCIPYCENCERGRCVGPNICECYNGFQKNASDQCVPVCQDTCVNGWCSNPNVCTCSPGYELDNTNQSRCNPICTLPCIQGTCIAPDVCECYPGYEFKIGSTNECLPICDFCENGNCTGPSNCTCWNNYEEKEIVQGTNIVKICQPKCENDCINGYCIEVDTCSCKIGYEFVKDSFNECEPVCDHPCLNGICVLPNQCTCDQGYKIIDDQCQAHCDDECINGFCVYPNQCECMDAYTFKFNSANVCEAFCENCTNGICVEPSRCVCLDGFKMTENNVCERMCQPECISGECVNGTCICEDGQHLVSGTCTDNNFSEWNDIGTTENVQCLTPPCENEDDLQLVTGTIDAVEWDDVYETTENVQCVPPCENRETLINATTCGINNEGCTNGTCVSGVCTCFDGYELNPSSPPFVCIVDEKITAIESAPLPVKAIVTNYNSLILALLIVGLTGITLIFLLYIRFRNCKVNYNVDEKERKVGVDGEDYVHYIANKDDHAFA